MPKKREANSFLLVGNQSGRQSGKKGFKLAGGRPRAAHSGRHGGRHSGRLRANQGSKVPVCGTVRGKLGDTKETRRETKWHTGFVPRFQVGDIVGNKLKDWGTGFKGSRNHAGTC